MDLISRCREFMCERSRTRKVSLLFSNKHSKTSGSLHLHQCVVHCVLCLFIQSVCHSRLKYVKNYELNGKKTKQSKCQ